MKYKVQLDTMLRDIANYFEARFLAEPTLQQICFPSTRELCLALRKAGVLLWLYSDRQVGFKLHDPWLAGPHREFRPTRNDCGNYAWVVTRPERLSNG